MSMKSKYGNKKVTIDVDGVQVKFDSTAEYGRYSELKLLEKAGEIRDLILQPIYPLQESFKRRGKTYRPTYYIADFQYIKDDEMFVEDVKGVATAVYQLKKRLFLQKYGEELRFFEIYYKRGRFVTREI